MKFVNVEVVLSNFVPVITGTGEKLFNGLTEAQEDTRGAGFCVGVPEAGVALYDIDCCQRRCSPTAIRCIGIAVLVSVHDVATVPGGLGKGCVAVATAT